MVLAVCAAACNALSSVLQRRAARAASPDKDFSARLFLSLVRQPVWIAAIGVLIVAFLLQAAALGLAGLTLVQPILVIELPFTLFIVRLMFKVRLRAREWTAILSLTGGLALLLVATGAETGIESPDRAGWVAAALTTVLLVAALVAASRLGADGRRAALLGVASGLCFAFTAALMKDSVDVLSASPAAVLRTWQVYAMVAAGIAALYLLQNALHHGTLVVVQPSLTVTDPVASIGFGVALFGDTIRLGLWAVPELAGIALLFFGSLRLSQSPYVTYDGITRPSR
ncbi:DMT family transporter [Nonomuraea pusilla]|uniref:DMT family transporter n=1 Tax=Nonomuraea pusilla TaxID=46177 RepID=UPI000B8A1A77|nr:DMT family transporter [Nonomuraea pusilla]